MLRSPVWILILISYFDGWMDRAMDFVFRIRPGVGVGVGSEAGVGVGTEPPRLRNPGHDLNLTLVTDKGPACSCTAALTRSKNKLGK